MFQLISDERLIAAQLRYVVSVDVLLSPKEGIMLLFGEKHRRTICHQVASYEVAILQSLSQCVLRISYFARITAILEEENRPSMSEITCNGLYSQFTFGGYCRIFQRLPKDALNYIEQFLKSSIYVQQLHYSPEQLSYIVKESGQLAVTNVP